MTIAIDVSAVDFFRDSPFRGITEASKVDRNTNIISDVKIIEAGDLNDERPWFVDDVTLQQTVTLGTQSKRGSKARYTHPTMSGDGMGKHLGRWKNFRVDNGAVYANLHIADVAFDTPNGDLATYIMDLAEEDPEAFGVSLAPKLDMEEMESLEADGKMPIRLTSLHAADVVDSPAATRGGFFSMDDVTADLPTHVTWILDQHFADRSYQELSARMDGYLRKYFKLKGRSLDEHVTDDAITPGDVVMNEELKSMCVASGMPEDLSDADAQKWLVENASKVLGSDERESLTTKIVDLESAAAEQVLPTVEVTDPGEVDAATLAATERASGILALCQTAGCQDKARGYIDDAKFTVDGVRKDLFEEVCSRNRRVPDDTEEPKPETDAFKAKCQDEYDKGGFTCTFDEYFASRKIDAGQTELRPSTAS